jgi:hypothetical protein
MSELELCLKVDNRRKTERLQSRPGLNLAVGGKPAKILNISSNGLRFVVSELQDADDLDLVLSLGQNRQEFVAKQAWSQQVGPTHYIVGVSIVRAYQRERVAVAC